MKKNITLLTGILSLQLVIAVSVFLLTSTGSGEFTSEPLLSFENDRLDRIVISGGDDEVTLLKNDEQWLLANKNLPIEQEKLEHLLKNLTGLQTTWPISTTSSSHERFEVSDDKSRRKISLFEGNKSVPAIFVGTSPGFKKSHLRVDDHDEVYALKFNAYDAPATNKDWLDKSLLALTSVTHINTGDYRLIKDGELWRAEPELNKREVDQGKVNEFANAIGTFKVKAIADDAPEFVNDKSIVLDVDNGDKYAITLMEDDGKYYVKRTGINHVFTLSQYEYEDLAIANIESFTSVKVTEDNVGVKGGSKEKIVQQ